MKNYIKYLLFTVLTTLVACSSTVSYDKWDGIPMTITDGSQFKNYVVERDTSTTLINGNVALVNEYVKFIVTTHKGGEETVKYTNDMDKLTITAGEMYKIEFSPDFDTSYIPPDIVRVEGGNVLKADMHALVTKYGFTQFFTPIGSLTFRNIETGERSITYQLVI